MQRKRSLALFFCILCYAQKLGFFFGSRTISDNCTVVFTFKSSRQSPRASSKQLIVFSSEEIIRFWTFGRWNNQQIRINYWKLRTKNNKNRGGFSNVVILSRMVLISWNVVVKEGKKWRRRREKILQIAFLTIKSRLKVNEASWLDNCWACNPTLFADGV